MLAMLVALKFHPRRGQLDRGKAHLQDLRRVNLSAKRAVIEGCGRAAFGACEWGVVVLERNGGMCNLVVHKFKSRGFHNFTLTYFGRVKGFVGGRGGEG